MRAIPFALTAIVLAIAGSTNADNLESSNTSMATPRIKAAVAANATAVDASEVEQVVYGEPTCCAVCEKKCCCHKRARIVCEMKKVTKEYWTCECEEVATMLPRVCVGLSLPWGGGSDCESCGETCGGEGCGAPCANPPKPGKYRTRRTPVLKTYTVEVPVYKCVVDYCCGGGCADIVDAKIGSLKSDEKSPSKVAEDSVPKVALRPNDEGYGG